VYLPEFSVIRGRLILTFVLVDDAKVRVVVCRNCVVKQDVERFREDCFVS